MIYWPYGRKDAISPRQFKMPKISTPTIYVLDFSSTRLGFYFGIVAFPLERHIYLSRLYAHFLPQYAAG